MTTRTTPEALENLLEGRSPFALIDIREAGEYNSSHIPGACPMPRRQLEFLMPPRGAVSRNARDRLR